MLTINLEEKLIKENKKTILTSQELLQVREYDRLSHIENDSTLNNLGLVDNIKKGKDIVNQTKSKKQQTLEFNQERVFHISQISSICDKYYLKFLPIKYFKGEVDDKLSLKINTFELSYNKKVTKDNSYIIAPEESFNLQEQPKDPLFFYQINDEWFYLIHKWGNDLNIFNRIKGFCRTQTMLGFGFYLLNIILFLFWYKVYKSGIDNNSAIEFWWMSIVISVLINFLYGAFRGFEKPEQYYHYWNSKFKQ